VSIPKACRSGMRTWVATRERRQVSVDRLVLVGRRFAPSALRTLSSVFHRCICPSRDHDFFPCVYKHRCTTVVGRRAKERRLRTAVGWLKHSSPSLSVMQVT